MAAVTDEVQAPSTTAPQTIKRKRPNMFRRMGRHWADYLYILPALGVMLLVIGYPVYYTIYLSFFNTPPSLAMSDKIWVGLDNYERILRSQSFRDVTKNTIIWTVFSTFFQQRSEERGRVSDNRPRGAHIASRGSDTF